VSAWDGKKMTYQSIERFKLPDERTLDLFVGNGDDQFRNLTYQYTRSG
jgi:hypothetical protein